LGKYKGNGKKVNMNISNNYPELRRICLEIADTIGFPKFTIERKDIIEKSRIAFERSASVRECLKVVLMEPDLAGHGAVHVRNVAIDAGAIVLLERSVLPFDYEQIERLSFLAHISGVLHDIKRSHPDHAQLGATEAEKILKKRKEDFSLEDVEIEMIVHAISNHEAFQPAQHMEEPDAQLLSDALYDADKFRWGPENFTQTLWNILESKGITDLSDLFNNFENKLEGIKKIRETFRTRTGQSYGPDFIDRGLDIGRKLNDLYNSTCNL
jgi:hypothetical protein